MITLRRLTVIAFMPLMACVLLYFEAKRDKYKDIPDLKKQLFFGLVFGVFAIISTEFGVPYYGAVINVRDSCAVMAGLFFGPISGIVAGLIGGVERWFSTYWSGGFFTRSACAVSTILTGLISAYLRKYIYEDKVPHWSLAFFTTAFCLSIHMLMIFITNGEYLRHALDYVKACAVPMITVNSITVGLASLFIGRIENDVSEVRLIPTVSSQYQRGLIAVVIICFILTSSITYYIELQVSKSDYFDMIGMTMYQTYLDATDAVNDKMLNTAREIAEDYYIDLKQMDIDWLAKYYGVREIMIVDNEGTITDTNMEGGLGFNLQDDPGTEQLMPVVKGIEDMYATELNEINITYKTKRAFAAIRFQDNTVVISYDENKYNSMVYKQLERSTSNRTIGESGFLLVVDQENRIITDNEFYKGKTLEELGIDFTQYKPESFQYNEVNFDGTDCYYIGDEIFDYRFLAFVPANEMDFSRSMSTYLNAFLLMLIFGVEFVATYYITKRRIVNNIDKVNDSLGEITSGNLETVVDVKSAEEFISLSNGINSTVDSLKLFIKEANERIDAELKTARAIQMSSLPNVFPAFPDYAEQFDLYALMDPAKEVGGDFYDFYLIDDDTIAFLVADVSGKGIPGALFMMRSKSTIRSFADEGMNPAEILTEANNRLCDGNDAGMFVTTWMGFLNMKTGELTFANAGHNLPLLRRKDGRFEYMKMPAGFVLAGMKGIKYKLQSITLEPGDELFLYTDGVVEATNPHNELYGDQRLYDCLNANIGKSAENICKIVKDDVDEFYKGAEQFDDITEMSFKFTSYRTED